MPRGLGLIQRECLRIISEFEAAGKRPSSFDIVTAVRDRLSSEPRATTIKHALDGLRRRGIIAQYQDGERSQWPLRASRHRFWWITRK